MPSIDEIIKQKNNPFDRDVTGNFCGEEQDQAPIVKSIHQQELAQIAEVLNQVAKDHRPRTVMLTGNPGFGKTYLLKRLKQMFDNKAFFAYIENWVDSDIWSHILRHTVDSLMHVQKKTKKSQLLLWVESILALKDGESLFEDRQQFINKMRSKYPSGIYNAKDFLGVLYNLKNPEMSLAASDWLRGDDLGREDLDALGVKSAIDSENAAQNILKNLGRISQKPIVLCFDQLDNIPRLQNNFRDLQALFNVNSSIHNYSRNNFLVIVNIIMDTWIRHKEVVQPADQDRINRRVDLKEIALDQAEVLWASRLYPLHKQANPKPASRIYPLTRQQLEEAYPRGRASPRSVLRLGYNLIQQYKETPRRLPKVSQQMVWSPEPAVNRDLQAATPKSPEPAARQDFQAALVREWNHEFQKTSEKITRIGHDDGPELINMLQSALKALQIETLKYKLLSRSATFASCSLSYQPPDRQGRVGLVWGEHPKMSSFSHLMKACLQAIQENRCQVLYLIRNEGVGQPNQKGNQIYQQIFTGSPHRHIKPDLNSVLNLATYYNLVEKAGSRKLVVADRITTLDYLEKLIRESKILHNCPLLQDLEIVSINSNEGQKNAVRVSVDPAIAKRDNIGQKVKNFVLDIVTNKHQLIGRNLLIKNACSQFPQVKSAEVEQAIEQLICEKIVKIVNPKAPREQQLICWVVPDATGRVK